MPLKIVADENINAKMIFLLRESKYQVVSIREDYKGITDREVLNVCKKEKAILLTEDSDFGELIFSNKEKDVSVLFLRYEYKFFSCICTALFKVLNKFNDDIYGKFIVITKNKIRVRNLL